MDKIAISIAKKIAASALSGVSSISVNGTTLNIVTNDGETLQMNFPTPKDGVSVVDITVNDEGNLVFILSDDTEIAVGQIEVIKGDKGDAGISPTIVENEDNTEDIYRLDIADVNKTITTPNLKDKYTHPTTDGYKHIPTGGTGGQVLTCISDGTAQWVSEVNNAKNATQWNNIKVGVLEYTDTAKATSTGLEVNLLTLMTEAGIDTSKVIGVTYIGCSKSGPGGNTSIHSLLASTGYKSGSNYAYISTSSDYMNSTWYFDVLCNNLGSDITPTYRFLVYYTD